MSTAPSPATRDEAGLVRLVHHYRDGHDFTTEAMLRRQAIAYMPVLHAVRVDAEHDESTFAAIELLGA